MQGGSYGALRKDFCDVEADGSRRPGPGGQRRRTHAVVAAVAVAACLAALAVLGSVQDDAIASGHAAVLEEEIGAFGTALNQRQVEDADAVFDDTFQDDPGHTSRGEIRFEAALRAAGGRNPAERRQRAQFTLQRRPNLRAQWTAIPEEDEKPSKVAVNIVASAPAPAPVRRLGMSDTDARSDLNSYFSSLASQVKEQEKRHAEHELGELSGVDSSSDSGDRDSSASKSASTRQSLGAVRRTPGQEIADQKVSALMKLVKKAAASKQFQEALVTASRDTYRGSVVGDFGSD